MWWQIGIVFWIAFQLGFFAACIIAASHRPVPAWAEIAEFARGNEASAVRREA